MKDSINLHPTFWDVFDEGSGPSRDPADEGPRPAGQAFVRQSEEVGHAVADAAHKAGRAAQDLQRPHHPTWDMKQYRAYIFITNRVPTVINAVLEDLASRH